MFVWLLISFALACVDSTFKVADVTLARASAKKGVQVFSSKPHFQYSVASISVLFSVILFVDSIPLLASLFTTWQEFSTRLDDNVFCLHFQMTSGALSTVVELGFVRLPLRKFTKSSDWKSWICRFRWQRVCHARAKLEVYICRRSAVKSAVLSNPQEGFLEPRQGGAADCGEMLHADCNCWGNLEGSLKLLNFVDTVLDFKLNWHWNTPHSFELMNAMIKGDEHCCNCNVLLGSIYKSITKVSHIHILNIWMIGQKGENC